MNYKIQRHWKTDEISGIEGIREGMSSIVIPLDENNIDYVEYLAWVADGNTAVEKVDKATRDINRLGDEWTSIRQERNRLLIESDWTQGEDSPLNASKKAEWGTYRQELRDVPTNQSSEIAASDITWPTKPADE